MEKNVRLRIASQFPGVLSLGGLTRAEYAGKQAWDRKPLAVKNDLIQTAKDRLERQRKGKSPNSHLKPPTSETTL